MDLFTATLYHFILWIDLHTHSCLYFRECEQK